MKKFYLLISLIICVGNAFAQKSLKTKNLSLPTEISYYDYQVSGLFVAHNNLYLLSESRLQDKAPALVFSIALSDLDKKLADSSFVLPYKKLRLQGIDALRQKMDTNGDNYEGLEALAIQGDDFYFSVETFTPAQNCYLIKGTLKDDEIVMSNVMVKMPKPRLNDQAVYNAGFEAMTIVGSKLIAFYEYNYFKPKSYAYSLDLKKDLTFEKDQKMQALPFRITDITHQAGKKYTAINFFYKGEGGDTVYRVPTKDKNFKLINDGKNFHNHLGLVSLKIKKKKICWRPIGELPQEYIGYNMEGITAYKNGWFVVNDKYTTKKPYTTTLLFVEE